MSSMPLVFYLRSSSSSRFDSIRFSWSGSKERKKERKKTRRRKKRGGKVVRGVQGLRTRKKERRAKASNMAMHRNGIYRASLWMDRVCTIERTNGWTTLFG